MVQETIQYYGHLLWSSEKKRHVSMSYGMNYAKEKKD